MNSAMGCLLVNYLDKEVADIYIILCGVASEIGCNIAVEVDRKMAINRARRWRITDEGHGYHIKDGEDA